MNSYGFEVSTYVLPTVCLDRLNLLSRWLGDLLAALDVAWNAAGDVVQLLYTCTYNPPARHMHEIDATPDELVGVHECRHRMRPPRHAVDFPGGHVYRSIHEPQWHHGVVGGDRTTTHGMVTLA